MACWFHFHNFAISLSSRLPEIRYEINGHWLGEFLKFCHYWVVFFTLIHWVYKKGWFNTNDQLNTPIELLTAVLLSSIAYGPFESDITFLCVVS